jgi:hypothetical protein
MFDKVVLAKHSTSVKSQDIQGYLYYLLHANGTIQVVLYEKKGIVYASATLAKHYDIPLALDTASLDSAYHHHHIIHANAIGKDTKGKLTEKQYLLALSLKTILLQELEQFLQECGYTYIPDEKTPDETLPYYSYNGSFVFDHKDTLTRAVDTVNEKISHDVPVEKPVEKKEDEVVYLKNPYGQELVSLNRWQDAYDSIQEKIDQGSTPNYGAMREAYATKMIAKYVDQLEKGGFTVTFNFSAHMWEIHKPDVSMTPVPANPIVGLQEIETDLRKLNNYQIELDHLHNQIQKGEGDDTTRTHFHQLQQVIDTYTGKLIDNGCLIHYDSLNGWIAFWNAREVKTHMTHDDEKIQSHFDEMSDDTFSITQVPITYTELYDMYMDSTEDVMLAIFQFNVETQTWHFMFRALLLNIDDDKMMLTTRSRNGLKVFYQNQLSKGLVRMEVVKYPVQQVLVCCSKRARTITLSGKEELQQMLRIVNQDDRAYVIDCKANQALDYLLDGYSHIVIVNHITFSSLVDEFPSTRQIQPVLY